MTPVELAAAVYEREPCAATFSQDLEAHLCAGYVHSIPSGFVMARPVCSTADVELILDPWHTFERDECDAWLIWLAAGDLSALLQFFPFPLPLIGWQKRNKLRFHGFESVIDRLQKGDSLTNAVL